MLPALCECHMMNNVIEGLNVRRFVLDEIQKSLGISSRLGLIKENQMHLVEAPCLWPLVKQILKQIIWNLLHIYNIHL